jgi:hypothetical protein
MATFQFLQIPTEVDIAAAIKQRFGIFLLRMACQVDKLLKIVKLLRVDVTILKYFRRKIWRKYWLSAKTTASFYYKKLIVIFLFEENTKFFVEYRSLPLGVKLSPGVEILCSHLHSSKQRSVHPCSTDRSASQPARPELAVSGARKKILASKEKRRQEDIAAALAMQKEMGDKKEPKT